jgi:hypothetical protein
MKNTLMLAGVAGCLVVAGAARASVSVIIEPPLSQPAAVAIAWAPPPMLIDPPPPVPFVGAVWIGGYWTWDDDWAWATGRWVAPPEPGWVWTVPYYDHRDDEVVFVDGFWAPPGVVFIPPPLGARIAIARPAPGVVVGPPPRGPQGVFVPPPPGSRPGVIVHAPLGTPPAVMVGAPPVLRSGMTVRAGGRGHFVVEAPAGVTRSGAAVRTTVPAQAHLAAALPAHVRALAPHLAPSHNFAQAGAPTHSAPIHSAPIRSAAPIHSAPIHSAPIHSAPIHSAPTYSAPMRPAPIRATPPPPQRFPPPQRAPAPLGRR